MEENEDNKIKFDSIYDECEYYKLQYNIYEIKYLELKKEYDKLIEENKKLSKNLNKEKKLRKSLEEKDKEKENNNLKKNKTIEINFNDILTNKNINIFDDEEEDDDNEESFEDILNDSKKNKIIQIINFSIFSNNNKLYNSNIINNKEENNINNINKEVNFINDYISKEEPKLINVENKHNLIINDKNNNNIKNNNFINKINLLNEKFKLNIDNNNNENEINNINNINNNDNNDNNNNDNNNIIINKMEQDLNEEKDLTKNFVIYGKDSVSLRQSIFYNENKIYKIYILLKKWRHYFHILEKGAGYFNKSVNLFNENLSIYINDNNNLLEEFPILMEQISFLQKCFSSINIYCSSLITTIDSSCSNQINELFKEYFKKLVKLRIKINEKINDISIIQNKFLTTKIKKKSSNILKENYYEEYKNIEILKYDYCTLINKILLVIKLKLPELISFLTYSYIIYFSKVKDEINEFNQIVRTNLENILKKIKIKNKVESDMDNNKNNITSKYFNNVDNTIKVKEGFLYMKDHDSNKFEKRYIFILHGILKYYKIKKYSSNEKDDDIENKIHLNLIDKVDMNESYEICNLLFSNIKKIDKKSSYPFCFEVNNAMSKKTYVFQAETEYEMEEWISGITNAISMQISGFDENKNTIINSQKDKNVSNDKNNINIINNNNHPFFNTYGFSILMPDKDYTNIINNNDININNNDNIIYHNSNELSIDLMGKKQLKDNEEKMKKIEKLIDENICADCGNKKPNWLNINWLTMICIDCSSIHRSLGVQISKIRSFELDNISNEYLELLTIIKQKEINHILEEKIIDNEKPKINSSREEKEKFIINKYKEKKYIINNYNNKNNIVIDIFKSIKKNNLLKIYKLVKLNSFDINKIYEFDNKKYGFIHYCAKLDMILCIKLFYILGADLNLEDPKGLKAIDYIDKNKQKHIYEYLVEKQNEKNK